MMSGGEAAVGTEVKGAALERRHWWAGPLQAVPKRVPEDPVNGGFTSTKMGNLIEVGLAVDGPSVTLILKKRSGASYFAI